jgi:hypothetical protein
VRNEYGGIALGVAAHALAPSVFYLNITKKIAAKPDVFIWVNAGGDQINSREQLREFGAFERMKAVGTVLYYSSVLGFGVDAWRRD